MLWNIYFSDLDIPIHNDDVLLNGLPVSHVEQADDVAIWSMSPEGLQVKLDAFFLWCLRNSMVISIKKTKWMLFGCLPRTLPVFLIDSKPIELVDSYKYVGLQFISTHRYILQTVYNIKASKARNITRAMFALELAIGCLPPREGIILYMARVDPHLIFGCEIVLDIDLSLLGDLEQAQCQYLRRLLGISKRSMRAILFTELGIEPIRYRRLGLALGYLQSLLIQPDHRVVRDAFTHLLHLARSGHATWVNDLRSTLSKLPIPVHCTVDELTDADNLARLRKDIRQSCEQSLTSDIQASVRVHLLHNRLEFREDGQQLHTSPIITLRAYLDVIKVPKHRHAFTRLITSSHALSIERLRYEERYRSPIPREWRLCHFCRGAVEDECHALMHRTLF
ncbi:hypothetical protein LENED_007714 [Lentinula edodes]|uniref:Reverse transcriptase domain-containing protein n=1 Tax=Lentinula edodes TaxID=5353 RepID=A0A1Q3EF48_LENED|nr:hypothetical protein LENED_007714 [Lentinula edodes]